MQRCALVVAWASPCALNAAESFAAILLPLRGNRPALIIAGLFYASLRSVVSGSFRPTACAVAVEISPIHLNASSVRVVGSLSPRSQFCPAMLGATVIGLLLSPALRRFFPASGAWCHYRVISPESTQKGLAGEAFLAIRLYHPTNASGSFLCLTAPIPIRRKPKSGRTPIESVIAFEGSGRADDMLEAASRRRARRNGGHVPFAAQHRLHQHDPGTDEQPEHPGNRETGDEDPLRDSLERGNGCPTKLTRKAPSLAATSLASNRLRPSMTPASCTFGMPSMKAMAAIWSLFRATPRPASTPAPYPRRALDRRADSIISAKRPMVKGSAPIHTLG